MPGEGRKKIINTLPINIFSIILAVIFSDQLSKILAGRFLSLGQSIPIIPGVFHLTLIHNRGAAFGMLKGWSLLFVLTAVIAVILIIFNLKAGRGKKMTIDSLALSLICAGGLGNLIDRLLSGHVVDFLDFRVWPVFNLADSAITVGAVLLGWSIMFSKKREGSNKCIRRSAE